MKDHLSPNDVRQLLAEQIKEAGNAAQWAFKNGYSKAFVSYVINGHKLPSKRMLDDLGLEPVRVYKRKGDGNVSSGR